jgi:molybdopterin-containing oxidoreductase family iron-sulfur binding subunit
MPPLPPVLSAPPAAGLPAGTRADEFPPGAAEWSADFSRREFVRLMAASTALAGLSGCTRRSLDLIVPRPTSADSVARAAGESVAFASAIDCEGYARGILVTAHDGRPTKIEGNPDHPASLGATDVFTQAAILSLYDPDRSSAPLHDGQPATWQAFEAAWDAQRSILLADRGAGLVLLTEPTTSPTLQRELHALLDAFPAARWFQHTPLARHDHRGAQPDFDFANADVILTVESDALYRHPAALRYSRAFAARRRVTDGRSTAPRFYALESSPSVTGVLADFRLPSSPARTRAVLNAVARSLDGETEAGDLAPAEKNFARALAADIQRHAGRVACLAGAEGDAGLQEWADVLNRRFGADVVTFFPAQRSDADPRSAGDLAALAAALDGGEVTTLCVLGSNPAYTAPGDLEIATRLRRVPFLLHLGGYADETAALAHWHLPESHFLETWSDLRAYNGPASVQQPLIVPLHDSRSLAEVLRLLRGAPAANAYDIVRETWRDPRANDFETRWARWLARGVVDEASPAPQPRTAPGNFPWLTPPPPGERATLTVVFRVDPNILDGRFANNAWLQELPKPLTHLVWDNAALVSATFAAEHGLTNGEVLACSADGATLEVPVWIMPGQAADTITVFLGYGRTQAGSVGSGLGYDAYRFRSATSPWQRTASVQPKPGMRRELVCTHGHFAMEGRDLARVLTPTEAARPRPPAPPAPSFYPAWKQGRYAWGMAIDLGTCLGCNACIIACQAENNTPVVGRAQVARGREMHWIRLDRYVTGDAANPRFIAQPVPCMQCENAPCEVVCPVAATVHSSEGLNDMVYNRCVGTRYCSNNCPYKVRRFNFFDYRAARESPLHLQENPNVTVRERGVMEKCTYCVQRINAARITAEKENRGIRDGEVRTACQQACPAGAIVFGDLNDPSSEVSRGKAESINYALLGELNTRPRTTYLAAVRHAALT